MSDMGRVQSVEPRWKHVQEVVIPVYEDNPGGDDVIYAPPGRVLTVSVVAERVFLAFCKYEEDNKTRTTTEIAAESLSAEALLNALIMQMGVEWVQGILRTVERGSS
jgi:hypothetical protein